MKKIALILCSLCFTVAARAEDAVLANWHQWRGPLATGVSPNGDPPIEWSDTKNVKWKAALSGRGSSTPIVWGDQVFVLTAIDTKRPASAADLPKQDPKLEKRTRPSGTYHQFVVLSFDRNSGKERWRHVATEQVPHEGHHDSHSYAAASPMTDGKRLIASFGSRGIFCYSLDGKLQWSRDLGDQQTRLGWGEAVTPLLWRDLVFVNWDAERDSFLVALDAATGEPRWKVERDEPTGWATPLIVEHRGKPQLITQATNRVRSYDPMTGKVNWQCGGQTVNAIPSPVAKDDLVVCMSGYRGAAAFAIPLDANGDLTGTDKVAWQYKTGTPYVPSPLLIGDRLYFTAANTPMLSCLNIKTGKPILDRERLAGLTSLYGSPVYAAGRIYLADRTGNTLVFKHDDKLEVLATNHLDDSFDGSPAVVGKQLFLRGAKSLYCLQAP